jgi:hypothetical protein
MPSYSLNLADHATLLRILVVLAEQAGGVLEFHSEDYDALDRSKLLTVDYDRKKGVNTLRVLGNASAAVSVAPEAHAWTQPPQSAPLERARTEATQRARRSHVPSDDELAALEEKMQREQELARLEAEGKAPLRIKTVS